MKSNDTLIEVKENKLPVPIAFVWCLAMGFYLLVILFGLLIRKCLITHGICANSSPKLNSSMNCCGSCSNCAQQCNCKLPTVDSCLDTICPTKQRINCIEFLVCDWASMQCCNEGGTYTCGSGDYMCTCETPQCDSINCLCCEISFRNASTAQ